MPRRNLKKKKETLTDPIFNSVLIQMLITRLLKKGKKQLATNILMRTLDWIHLKTNQDALSILESAVRNLSPSVKIYTKRIGGAVYSVPKEVQSFRSTNLAIQLLLETAKKRTGKKFYQKLAVEIIDASTNLGLAIKKKEEVQRIAEANSKLTKKY